MTTEQQGAPPSRLSRLRRVSIFKKGHPSIAGQTLLSQPAVVAVEIQQSPLVSLPVEILLQIISYLAYAERFTLKLSGSGKIRSILESQPKPSYKAYLRLLSEISLSLPQNLQQVLNIASSVGYEALLLKLVREELVSPTREYVRAVEGYVGPGTRVNSICEKLSPALEHAAKFSQLNVSKILIKNGARNDNSSLLYKHRSSDRSALEWAATNGDLELAARLFKIAASVRHRNEMPCAVSYAARNGHDAVVKLLVKRVHRDRGRRLSRPLAEAAVNCHPEIVDFLLGCGAKIEVNKYCPTSHSPLHSAAKGGSVEIFRMMLEKGAKDCYIESQQRIGETYSHNWCTLHFAAFHGHKEIIKILLDEGLLASDPGSENTRDSVVAIATAGGHVDTVKELLERGFSAQSLIGEGHSKESALHLAASKGDIPIMTLLLDFGADIESSYGGTPNHPKDFPLSNAAFSGSRSAIELLLDRGADIDAVNEAGFAALHIASMVGRTDAVACLLERGARTDIRDKMGRSAACCSIQYNHESCLVLLLSHRRAAGLDPVVDNHALHFAAEFRRSNVVPLLLKHGANAEARLHRNGRLPLHYAAECGAEKVMEMLLSEGADPQARCHDGQTALHFAVGRNYGSSPQIYAGIVENLLQAGVDVNAVDASGKTPLHVAGQQRQRLPFDLLVSYGAHKDVKDGSGMTARDYFDTITDGIGGGCG